MSLSANVWSFEPAFLAHVTAVSMIHLVINDFLEQRTCRVNLGYSDHICLALKSSADEYPKEAQEIQKLMGTELSSRAMIKNAIPILLVFLIGPWSDTYGRKFPVLLSVTGFLLQALFLALFSCVHEEIGAWPVIIASSLMVSLTGNQQCFMMAAFSYVTESVPVEKITLRITILQSFIYIGFFSGLLLSGMLVHFKIGFPVIFLLVTGLETFAFFYLFYNMHDVPRFVPEGMNRFDVFMELFDFQHLRNAVHAVFRNRPRNDRFKLALLLFVHTCTQLPMYGEGAVTYQFCRLQFNWDLEGYGAFMTYQMIVGCVVNLSASWLLNDVINFTDPSVGIIGMICSLLGSIVAAFSTTWKMIYSGQLLTSLSGPANSIPRSAIGKIVAGNELGKINSFMASLESMIPFIASPIYAATYSAYIDVFPGAFYLISAFSNVPPIAVYWWMLRNPPDDP